MQPLLLLQWDNVGDNSIPALRPPILFFPLICLPLSLKYRGYYIPTSTSLYPSFLLSGVPLLFPVPLAKGPVPSVFSSLDQELPYLLSTAAPL